MEMEFGKLFIGGISWDTNEERLREYFQNFGEVVEAVIMKDRNTGRARGFGFVVFADPYVAERVVLEKHVIDGRTVEAKKAVPRDDQTIVNRNTNSSIQGSPGPVRTKKIFVGGLASSVTESDFKSYFDQFGTITDVVVMYDHNTQRPRGFGFITYDSEESVEKVLLKTFHELNGKMVEVKRAVPKELSPGPSRNQLVSLNNNYGISRVNSFINGFNQGFNQSPFGSYGVRMDGRFSPVTVGRSGYPPPSPGFGLGGLNFEAGLGQNYGGGGNINSSLGFGRGVSPLFSGQSNRYGTTLGYDGGNVGNRSPLSSMNRNLWGNTSFNYGTNSGENNAFRGSENGNLGLGAFGSIGEIWSSPSLGQRGISSAYNHGGNHGYDGEDNNGGSGGGYGRNVRANVGHVSSYAALNGGYDTTTFGKFYEGGSMYGDPTWQVSSSEVEGSGPFDFGLRNTGPGVADQSSTGYVDSYGVTNRQSIRGIAT